MHVPVVAGLSLTPIAKPIAAILAAIYGVIPNYGVAILVLSLGWMLLISPLTLKTTRSMLAMQKLQPQLKKLQEQHKNDRQALSQATMDLYRENNVSPFGSCLPTLLPLPVFFALFRVIDGLSHVTTSKTGVITATPKYLATNTQMYHDIVKAGGHLNAFGLDLSKNVLSSHSSIATTAPYVLVLLIMMGTQYWQTVSMMNRNPANADNPQAKMMKYLPLIFGVISIRFPAGVIVYYAMSNVCRVTQQGLMYRFDPKVRTLAAKDISRIDAEAHDIEDGKRAREVVPQAAPRSRFRDLLASAADQQTQMPSAKGSSARSRPTGGAAGKTTANTKAGANTKANSAVNGTKGKGAPPKGAAKSPANGSANGVSTTSGTPADGGGKPIAAPDSPSPALAGSQAGATGTVNTSTNGGGGPPRPRTGAGAGRTGASTAARNKKRRGR